jgi:hypothetical protein
LAGMKDSKTIVAINKVRIPHSVRILAVVSRQTARAGPRRTNLPSCRRRTSGRLVRSCSGTSEEDRGCFLKPSLNLSISSIFPDIHVMSCFDNIQKRILLLDTSCGSSLNTSAFAITTCKVNNLFLIVPSLFSESAAPGQTRKQISTRLGP